MSDDVVEERPHDQDATVVMPTIRAHRGWDNAGFQGHDHANDETRVLPAVDDTGTAVARHGSIMAMASVVSRVTGYLRTAAIGAALGAAVLADDYTTANILPGMVYELLLGGVLASVVVPLIVRARTKDADQGEAYAQRLLSLAAIFLAGATVIAVACAPIFTRLLTGDATKPADVELIRTLSYLVLPMIFFYGMAALFAAILNTRGNFVAPALTPILNNLIVIVMAGTFVALPHVNPPSAETMATWQVLLLGLGTTLGIVVQAFGLWPALRRVGFRWKWRWDFRQLHLRELVGISSWMLVYVLVSQLAVFVIFSLANRAGSAGAAAGGDAAGSAIFNNAFLIFMMAHGIIAVSIITVLMPRMAAAAAEGRHEDLAYQISFGTRLAAVILIPVTAVYLILGRPLAVTLFEWGSYSHEQAIDTGWVIAVAGLGLVPFAISQLQLFAFYAMPDTKTPAVINVPVVALRIGIDVAFFVVLPSAWVAAGLMGGNGISYLFAVLLGYVLLRRRLGRLGLRHVLATLTRLAVAALIAAVPTIICTVLLISTMGDGKGASVVTLIVGGIVLLTTYVGVAFALRVREVRELATMVRGRLGR